MRNWIVIVDDEAMSLTNARIMLGEENMRVSCLRSGRELLKFVEKNTPDLILLDILMPDMDGFETYHALRELEEHMGRSHIPVVFCTGENDSASEQQGLELGASDYIRKPYNKEILIKRIENTINNSSTIETLKEEAMVDTLTGFLNKTHGTERISKLCSRKNGSLIILDLDNFKLVNDLFGHETGDKVLAAFSDIVRRNTRETDTLCRIGGDEFMAFCDDLTAESSLASITLRINTQLCEEAERLMGKDHGIPLGISAGVVMVPEYGRDYEELFSMADSALYKVKKEGKHGYCLYHKPQEDEDPLSADQDQKLERIIKIVEERNDAGGALMLGNDSFALVYRFIMRFYKRYGGTAALVLFTISMPEGTDNIKLLETSSEFSGMLQKNLRVSDIIMQNGSCDFFVMLTERTKAEAEGATKRILECWERTGHDEEAVVDYAFKYIDHAKDVTTN